MADKLKDGTDKLWSTRIESPTGFKYAFRWGPGNGFSRKQDNGAKIVYPVGEFRARVNEVNLLDKKEGINTRSWLVLLDAGMDEELALFISDKSGAALDGLPEGEVILFRSENTDRNYQGSPLKALVLEQARAGTEPDPGVLSKLFPELVK